MDIIAPEFLLLFFIYCYYRHRSKFDTFAIIEYLKKRPVSLIASSRRGMKLKIPEYLLVVHSTCIIVLLIWLSIQQLAKKKLLIFFYSRLNRLFSIRKIDHFRPLSNEHAAAWAPTWDPQARSRRWWPADG